MLHSLPAAFRLLAPSKYLLRVTLAGISISPATFLLLVKNGEAICVFSLFSFLLSLCVHRMRMLYFIFSILHARMIDVNQKQCSICARNTGVMTCSGCQQVFCGKHSLEHRQQLASQLDGMIREHDSLRPELERTPKDQTLSDRIDAWERESIAKIQTAARTARQDLLTMLEKAKEPRARIYQDMMAKLRSSREADDYSEIELKRWMKQLQQLKSDMTGPSPLKLVENEWAMIKLINIKDMSYGENVPKPNTQDRFSRIIGNVSLDGDGFLARHTSSDWNYEYVLGEQSYHEGRHTILFRIEKCGVPYNIFFGCISSDAIRNRISINSSSAVGWAGFNQVFRHGVRNGNLNWHGYYSSQIAAHDVLSLTFDCDKRQIELFHEDSNMRHILSVDVQQAPLPWQLLVMLTDKEDCVRILQPPVPPPTMQLPPIEPPRKGPPVAAPKKAPVVQPKGKAPTVRPKGKAPARIPKTRKT